MMNTQTCQTGHRETPDIAVNDGMVPATTSKEYIDRLVSDMIQNKTLYPNATTTLLTTQEEIDKLVEDLLRNAAYMPCVE